MIKIPTFAPMKRILFVTALAMLQAVTAVAQGAFVFPSEVKPLLHTAWGQEHPYNKLCPWERHDTVVRHSPAGCGPLVMAQVMRRYSSPARSSIIGTAYDWADMPDTATDSTATGQQDAVAQLIVDCGTAAGTVYTQSASATKINGVVAGLKKYFGYSRYMHIADRACFGGAGGQQAWKQLIFGELKAGRPVIIRAERNSHDAHVFIIDGCRDSTVHVNWGWGGKLNGYYNPDTLGGYRLNQRMVVDVAPEPYRPAVRTITLRRPGTLGAHIRPADRLTLRHLRLTGAINGADIRLLRSLAGGGADGPRGGALSTIDMSRAVILTMPDSAFYGCNSLTYVALPLTLPEISRYAFAACQNLNRIDIPPMVGEIKRGAFYGCFNLTGVSLPASLRTIGASAFNSCNSLTEVRLPRSVTAVGPGAFAYSRNLHTLTAPKTLHNIGRDATKGTALTKITRL